MNIIPKNIFLKTSEDDIYGYHIIKNVIMPKFFDFIFEVNMNNDSYCIPDNITASLIKTETIIKAQKNYLLFEICAPTINKF